MSTSTYIHTDSYRQAARMAYEQSTTFKVLAAAAKWEAELRERDARR